MSKIYGEKGVIIDSIQTSTDPRTGGNTTISGHAFSDVALTPPAAIVNYCIAKRNTGWGVSIANVPESHKWTFTATYNDDQILNENETWIPDIIWEIEQVDDHKSLLACIDRPFIKSLSTNTKQLIEYAVKHASTTSKLTSEAEVKQLPAARITRNLLLNGVESFGTFSTVVKRTLILPSSANPKWMLVNDNCVLTKAYFVSKYSVPYEKAILIPAGDTTIQTVNEYDTLCGYRQSPAFTVSIPGNKTQYIQKWTYGRWSVGNNGGYDVVGVKNY